MKRRTLLAAGAATVLLSAGGVAETSNRASAMHDYDAAVLSQRRMFGDKPALTDLVRFATLAPSGHNTQPWQFRLRSDGADIIPDRSRRTPVVDPDDHHLYVGLGAAAENLALAACAAGTPGEWRYDPSADAIAFRFAAGRPAEPALFAAIPQRRSSRTIYDDRPVSAADQGKLIDAARTRHVDFVLLNDPTSLSHIRDLVLAGNTAQIADAAFVRELKNWIRFNPRRALATGDGLFSAASGSLVVPDWLGAPFFDRVFTAASENDKYARQLRSTPLIAVFAGAQPDPAHWTEVGRAAQRFALQATALGLAHAFINQPVEVAALRAGLATLAGLPGRRPDLVMRLGHGPTLPFSARRPVTEVLA